MLNHIDIIKVRQYIDDTKEFLISKMCTHEHDNHITSGWHNFFAQGKIGTTGTATPYLFFHHLGQIPEEQKLISTLIDLQNNDAAEHKGGWPILSIARVPTVEGTAWPLKALTNARDDRARFAAMQAEDWLIRNQNPDGGWGSLKNNSSRVLLTCTAIDALLSIKPSKIAPIKRSLTWLSEIQNPDGSWGSVAHEAGTLYHTALATRIMTIAQRNDHELSISKGLEYIKAKWAIDSSFFNEIYDIIYNGTPSRIVLNHDVDAEIIKCLITVNPVSEEILILNGINSFINYYERTKKLNPSKEKDSLWNIVPRAEALLKFYKTYCFSNQKFFYAQDHSLTLQTNYPISRTIFILIGHSIQNIFNKKTVNWITIASLLCLSAHFLYKVGINNITDKDILSIFLVPVLILFISMHPSK